MRSQAKRKTKEERTRERETHRKIREAIDEAWGHHKQEFVKKYPQVVIGKRPDGFQCNFLGNLVAEEFGQDTFTGDALENYVHCSGAHGEWSVARNEDLEQVSAIEAKIEQLNSELQIVLKKAWESGKPISYEDAKRFTEERDKGFEATEKRIREEIGVKETSQES